MSDWDDFLDNDRPLGRSDNNNLVELLNKLLRNWYWFALCAVTGLGIAWFQLKYSTPIYTVHAKLLVLDEGSSGQSGFLEGFGNLLGTQRNVDNEAEVLRTYDLMRLVVDELDIYITFRHKGRVRNVELLDPPYQLRINSSPDSIQGVVFDLIALEGDRIKLQGKNWERDERLGVPFTLPGVGSATLIRTSSTSPNDVYQVEVVTPENQTASLQSRLGVSVTNRQTSTIDLSIQHAVPNKGIIILKTLLDKYVSIILEDKNQVADSTLAFIDERLSTVTGELNDAEDDISQFKQRGGLTDLGEQATMLMTNTSAYTRELAETEGQLLMLDELERYLNDPREVRVLPSLVGISDAGFAALVQRYNALILDRDRLLMSHTPDNPYIQNLDEQIQGLRTDMRSSIQSSRRQLEATRNNLQRQVDRLKSEIRNVPATERDFIDLSRQQQIKQELYLFLQQKREETAIGKMANIPNVKVIDSPRANGVPISPKRNMTLATGLLLGLALPFAVISIRSLFNVRIRGHDDIRGRTDIPLVATIGHSEADSPIVVSETARSPVAEQFRTLRTNLSFSGSGQNTRTILTTSSMSGEGKSFIALNLALSMALTGKKVALLELDLRKPVLSSKLGVKHLQGFTNYVVNSQLSIADVVHPTEYDNLYFVSSGPIPPNPAELILKPRTKDFFERMSEAVDILIIDTAPIGLVTDAQLLDVYADTCLYVVRQDITYKKQLEIPQELVHNKKITNLNLILNDAKVNKGYGYQGYGYGYGYYGDERPKNIWKKLWGR